MDPPLLTQAWEWTQYWLPGFHPEMPPVTEAPHGSPTPVRAEGAGAWPSAPLILANSKSGWHHAQLISKSLLARYLLGGSLGKRRQLGRSVAQAYSLMALWPQRFIALMKFGL